MLLTLEFIRIIPGIAWPLVVAGALYYFREEIMELLSRFDRIRAKKGDLEMIFDRGSSIDVSQVTNAKQIAHPNNVPNIFWAGHDLIFVMFSLSERQIASVKFGLIQSIHHLNAAGIGDGTAQKNLQKILDRVLRMPSEEWDDETRRQILYEVVEVRNYLQAYFKIAYPGYKAQAEIQ